MEDADRLARLETHAEHGQSQLAEVKDDIKDLRKDVRESRDALAALALSTEKGFAATNAVIAALALTTEKSIAMLALSMERSMRRVQVGFLMMGGGLLAVIARAFHWL